MTSQDISAAAAVAEPDAIARELREALGADLVARMTRVEPEFVDQWAAGGRTPGAQDERTLRAVFEIYKTLADPQTPKLARAWLLGLNPNFERRQPAEVFASGQTGDVLIEAENYVNA